MASLFKNLSKSVSVSAEAVTTTVQASANIISSVAKTTEETVAGLSSPIINTLSVVDNYTVMLKMDSELDLSKAEMLNKTKKEALKSVLEDEETISKIQDIEKKKLLDELLED